MLQDLVNRDSAKSGPLSTCMTQSALSSQGWLFSLFAKCLCRRRCLHPAVVIGGLKGRLKTIRMHEGEDLRIRDSMLKANNQYLDEMQRLWQTCSRKYSAVPVERCSRGDFLIKEKKKASAWHQIFLLGHNQIHLTLLQTSLSRQKIVALLVVLLLVSCRLFIWHRTRINECC